MGEERKLVTILFADVVGSTAMAGDNDPEVVRNVMGRYFQRLTEIAESHGGTVEKFAGDSVMVVFGVPAVHDDDAERAVRAALATREAVAELSPRLPIALAVRVGVNSGEAVTAAREDRQFMVSGDPVNVAARLQQAAAPGEVLVGELTHSLTRAVIEYEARQPIEAKGKPDALPAFRALRAISEIPVQSRGIPGLKAPLVGRVRELRLLVDTFGRVAEDRRPHHFTLVGSGGIGKSRLVAEALAHPALTGATVLRGRCLPYGTGITFWPLIEMFDRRLPDQVVSDSEWPAVRARLGVMLGLETAGTAMPDVPPEMVSREIGWALRRHLQGLAATSPVVAVIDDVQWGEPALVTLVQQLTDRMADVPLLLLTIARPELLEAHPTWAAGKADATTLTLAPLDAVETSDLISRLLDVDGLPEALREEVVLRSEGTPLYCEEFLRMLIEDGLVAREGNAWRATSQAVRIRVPHTIQALLAARLDGLTGEEKIVLQAASVVGERFQEREVAALVGEETGRLLDALLAKGLVIEGEGPGELGFRHILIRDAAYGSIPKARRADLHDVYVSLLRGQAGAGDQLVEMIGHHSERAFGLSAEILLPEPILVPRARLALEMALLTVQRALSRKDTTVAEGGLDIARRAAETLPDSGGLRQQAQLALLRGQFLASRGDYQGSRVEVSTATRLAREGALGEVLAEALVAEMYVDSQAGEGSFDDLDVMLQEAATACRAVGDKRREIEARAIAWWRLWSIGDLTGFVAGIDELVDQLDSPEDESLKADLMIRAAGAVLLMGGPDNGAARLRAAEDIVRRRGLTYLATRAELGHGSRALLAGDVAHAERLYRSMLELAGDNESMVVTALRFLSYALDEQGRHEEAAEHLEKAIDISESSGDRWHRSELHSILARQVLKLGDVDRSDQLVATSLQWLRDGDVSALTEAMQALAQVRSAQGRPEEAEAALLDGQQAISPTDFNWPRTIIAVEYADFLSARGRGAEAEALLAERDPILDRAGWHVWDARIAAIRARIRA